MSARRGWAVAIRRIDGSEFLATSGCGVLPAVWPLSQRRYATQHKRELAQHGLKGRVVQVAYRQPSFVQEPADG